MKADKLKDIMRFNGLPPLYRGSGSGGRILNVDMEDALGDHFFKKKFPGELDSVGIAIDENERHMILRRSIRPMKAYRYTNLKPDQQQSVLLDENGWIGECKWNGWRILATHIPGDRLHFFGSNLSTTEFLPVDYTYHLPEMRVDHPLPIILDMEAVCFDTVIQQDGFPSTDTREAIAAILGSGVEVAQEHQKDAKVVLMCFDAIPAMEMSLSMRKKILAKIDFDNTDIRVTKYYSSNKKKALNRMWKEGHEGMILKNLSAGHDSGGRKRTHCIKIKKAASSIIGDTIDAFISGYILTPVHSYNDLIGGVELSVYIDDKPEVIATVTNLPDYLRYSLTQIVKGLPVMVEEAYGKVLEIDGQEFSSRNRQLMHATVVSWDFRKDKSQYDCTMEPVDFGGKF